LDNGRKEAKSDRTKERTVLKVETRAADRPICRLRGQGGEHGTI
jgi:hypothetical protein